ncbi:hypothetical protein AK812_SmicGene18531 [Symbiodinium microadriaticum]|uniref:TraB domain-containing protein n=1 Tax=Symbiodinium microadriaticum TaxID=2951 RepID=A0A1Q9DUZ2_SYMMI|nr:hypothetical protein AK812_SmicGene18531 [Symbiodinium microadriaticum]CAE7900432.1 unnamed protein product [Symbiodinium sp. KB8]
MRQLRSARLALRRVTRNFTASSPGLSQTVEHLRHPLNTGEVFLVGTSHISEASAKEVHDIIHTVRPRHVVVELCEARRRRLEASTHTSNALTCSVLPGAGQLPKNFAQIVEAFYAMLRSAGFDPGVDMLSGLRAGKEVGAVLHCGDVDAKVTSARMDAELRALGADHMQVLAKLMRPTLQREVSELFPDAELDIQALMQGDKQYVKVLRKAVEGMKDRAKVRKLGSVMSDIAPGFTNALLHVRDAHLAKLLRSAPFDQATTVCVVGMAHMDGIARRYTDAKWQEEPWKPPKVTSGQSFPLPQSLDAMTAGVEPAIQRKPQID